LTNAEHSELAVHATHWLDLQIGVEDRWLKHSKFDVQAKHSPFAEQIGYDGYSTWQVALFEHAIQFPLEHIGVVG
jgi:DNA-binding MurR/RpiR family transcriptional regulator